MPLRASERALRVHDQFVMHLVEAVSRTHPEMLSSILSGSCVTTNAIRESVFGSAIRQKNYTIVSRLLQSGVDPNLQIIASQSVTGLTLRKGKIYLTMYYNGRYWTGMKEAALTLDAHLGKILLNAGASVNKDVFGGDSPLEIAMFATANDASASNRVIEFAQHIVEHHTYGDHSMASCSCICSGLILAITHAITRRNIHVAKFLLSKVATIQLPKSFEVYGCRCDIHCRSDGFDDLGIRCVPLHIAIVSGDEEIIDRLLWTRIKTLLSFHA